MYNNGYNSLRLKFLSEFHSNLLSFGYGGKNPADFSATYHSQKRWAQYPNRTQMKENKDRVIIASDVNERDGIGVEIFRNDELIAEIFRDDTEKTRTIRVFKETISLELMEECIQTFKKEIPWEFIEYDETD